MALTDQENLYLIGQLNEYRSIGRAEKSLKAKYLKGTVSDEDLKRRFETLGARAKKVNAALVAYGCAANEYGAALPADIAELGEEIACWAEANEWAVLLKIPKVDPRKEAR